MHRLYALFVVLALVSLPGCAGKVTGATPIASSALRADAVILRVNELQATVIDVCGPAPECRPGGVTTAQARLIVQTCMDARATLKAVPAGWQASLKAAWAAALPKFSAVTNPAIVAAVGAVTVLVGGL